MEKACGISSSQLGGNRHVSDQMLFRTNVEKPKTRKPVHRSTTEMQNPKSFHPPRTASVRVELVDKAVRSRQLSRSSTLLARRAARDPERISSQIPSMVDDDASSAAASRSNQPSGSCSFSRTMGG